MLQLLQPAGTDLPSCRANQLLTSPNALYDICSYTTVHKMKASHGLVDSPARTGSGKQCSVKAAGSLVLLSLAVFSASVAANR